MKNIATLLFLIVFSSNSFAQTTVTFQPDSSGKDATIWYLDTQNGIFGPTNTTPQPNSTLFHSVEWTWNGSPGTTKGLLDFDLSSLPQNILITNAKLSLYSAPWSEGGHQSLSGSNEARIAEITSPWDENTVTWNTQPTTDPNGQIILAQSTSEFQDYLDIDVTAIIQNKWSNPTLSHGFMISILDPNYYRAMVFGSSDHADPNKHPKLEVTYTSTSGLQEQKDEIGVLMYPNPTKDKFFLEMESNFSYAVTDLAGKEIIVESEGKKGITEIDLSKFDAGSYLVKIVMGEKETTKSIQKI